MATSIPTLLQTLCSDDDSHAAEIVMLATELGVSPRTARLCCRRLRALMLALDAANDNGATRPATEAELSTRWLSTMRLGVRLLTVEAGASVAAAATRILASIDGEPANQAPVRRVSDAELRSMISRAVTERRVLSIEYASADSRETTEREVEPLTLSNLDGHWTVLAFCRSRKDLRSFRFDRVLSARVTEHYFEARQGLSLERFIHRRRIAAHQRLIETPIGAPIAR